MPQIEHARVCPRVGLAKARAQSLFGMQAMAHGIEDALHDAVALGPVECWAARALTSVKDVLMAVVLSLVAYLLFRFVISRV